MAFEPLPVYRAQERRRARKPTSSHTARMITLPMMTCCKNEETPSKFKPLRNMLDAASEHSLQPENCRNRHRSLRPDVFVAIGQCTHQACTPQLRSIAGHAPGFLCPCHSSKFDLAGRVYRGGPAPANLVIPIHRLHGEAQIVVGEA